MSLFFPTLLQGTCCVHLKHCADLTNRYVPWSEKMYMWSKFIGNTVESYACISLGEEKSGHDFVDNFYLRYSFVNIILAGNIRSSEQEFWQKRRQKLLTNHKIVKCIAKHYHSDPVTILSKNTKYIDRFSSSRWFLPHFSASKTASFWKSDTSKQFGYKIIVYSLDIFPTIFPLFFPTLLCTGQIFYINVFFKSIRFNHKKPYKVPAFLLLLRRSTRLMALMTWWIIQCICRWMEGWMDIQTSRETEMPFLNKKRGASRFLSTKIQKRN